MPGITVHYETNAFDPHRAFLRALIPSPRFLLLVFIVVGIYAAIGSIESIAFFAILAIGVIVTGQILVMALSIWAIGRWIIEIEDDIATLKHKRLFFRDRVVEFDLRSVKECLIKPLFLTVELKGEENELHILYGSNESDLKKTASFLRPVN